MSTGNSSCEFEPPRAPPEADLWSDTKTQSQGLVMAVDAKTGRKLWESKPDAIAPLTLAVHDGRVFYVNYGKVVCLDLSTGKQRWRSETVGKTENGRAPRHSGAPWWLTRRLCSTPRSRRARRRAIKFIRLPPTRASLLWRGPAYTGPGITNPPDLFVVDDLVWLGETKLPVSYKMTEIRRKGLDPTTGDVAPRGVGREVVEPGTPLSLLPQQGDRAFPHAAEARHRVSRPPGEGPHAARLAPGPLHLRRCSRPTAWSTSRRISASVTKASSCRTSTPCRPSRKRCPKSQPSGCVVDLRGRT